ncbi:hypothetical protein G5V59_08360 [Nocardioides sp. W3-2-3]|uniref:hypothetical protein n=1 Tax=Nocardioides convexus TaxID=2712224 RepID=UPI002418416F|nr:hypothetical protein [Nocardioides convexus]NHA00153.1 hypothetical protein [Nocardioides convexus]
MANVKNIVMIPMTDVNVEQARAVRARLRHLRSRDPRGLGHCGAPEHDRRCRFRAVRRQWWRRRAG